jgi:uncharacterized SAM-binding protein YcdF (DUF218 family)
MGPGPIRTDTAEPTVKRPRRRCWPRGLAIAAGLLVLLALVHPWLLAWAGAYLDASSPPRPVDDVLILGGDVETRPFVAAALYKAGLAKRVLLTNVKHSHEVEDGLVLSEPEIARQVLLKRGVPADAIVLLPDVVDSTADEARSLKRYLDENPGRTAAVVTNDYHTRRARLIFRAEIGERAADLPFFAAPTEGFGAGDWWRSERGCAQYADEYVKMLWFLVSK